LARRNNPERFAAPQPDDSSPAPNIHNDAPQADPLAFVVPTEFVNLPSQGKYYPIGHPLHGSETLEIRYMTAKEEDLLSSQGLLEKGLVLDRLIENLIVDKKMRSRDLLIADRDAILVAARASAYGHNYQTKLTCGQCGDSETHDYDLGTALMKPPLDAEELSAEGITTNEDGTFSVSIPNSPVEVVFRLLNGHDERAMMDAAQVRKKRKLPDQWVTDQLNAMLVSVLDHTEKATLQKFVETLPLRDSRFLRQTYETVCPAVKLRKEFVCGQCGHEDEITFPFTTDFFWPDAGI
jgi:hypothetical protein